MYKYLVALDPRFRGDDGKRNLCLSVAPKPSVRLLGQLLVLGVLLTAGMARAVDMSAYPPIYQTAPELAEQAAELLSGDVCAQTTLDGKACLDIAVSGDPYNPNAYAYRLTEPRCFSAERYTLAVTFLDRGAGLIQPQILTDDAFNGTWAGPARQRSYTMLNTGGVRTAWFEFTAPGAALKNAAHPHLRIAGLQHLIDLRVGPPLSEVDWQAVTASVPTKVKPMVTLNRPMELVTTAGVSVMDTGADDLANSLDAMIDTAPLARVLGFTAIESYVLWRRIEPKLDAFDFSFYDAIVKKLGEYDLKWFPLLVVGSAYALPDWFADDPENVGFVCLEHGLSNAIQSIWSPYHAKYVTKFLKAFGDHYTPMGVLEGVRVGPSGNFGESQYPAGGNWGYRGSAMHIHIGWWAGDAHAKADFQQFLKRRYTGIEALNKAWDGTHFRTFDEISVPMPELCQSRRERIDMSQWYTDSMSNWCNWWAREAAKYLPGVSLYQSAGGWGFREAGTDYPSQTKAVAELHGGVRLTNETDSYEQNFYATRLAMTSAKLYGARIGEEPASSHTARGVTGRLYGLLAVNGDHFFTYQGNIFNSPLGINLWLEQLPMMDERRPPLVDVAVYYPETMNQLDDGAFRNLYAWGFNPYAKEIRRVVDVDYLDETLIRDGFLDRYKALVFAWGSVTEADVLEKVDAWMRAGGTVIYPPFPRTDLETVEGDKATAQRWARGDTGKGAFFRFKGDMEPPELYGEFAGKVLRDLPSLNPWTRAAIQAEHPEHVFLTVQNDGHLLILNYGEKEATVRLPGVFETTVQPWHMGRVALGQEPSKK